MTLYGGGGCTTESVWRNGGLVAVYYNSAGVEIGSGPIQGESQYQRMADYGKMGLCQVAPPCSPGWVCEQPLNGYENDGCGNRRLNTACNPPTPPPSCSPNWACELPLNGYEKDGCGNRRLNTACNPPTPSKCTEGATRKVQCPKDPNKTITQTCKNGAWVTLPADEKACEKTDQVKIIIAAVIIAIVLIFLWSKAGK